VIHILHRAVELFIVLRAAVRVRDAHGAFDRRISDSMLASVVGPPKISLRQRLRRRMGLWEGRCTGASGRNNNSLIRDPVPLMSLRLGFILGPISLVSACARLQELDALVYTQTVIQKPLVLWADSGLTCAPPVRIYAGMRSLLDFGPLTGQS